MQQASKWKNMRNPNLNPVAALHPASYAAQDQQVHALSAGKKPKITFLSLKAVLVRTASSRTSTYARMDPKSKYYDPAFPKQVRISANRVVWIESEIDAWLESRVTASRN
jgi:prophage regulatory protein